jgi:hypothetical protein
MGEAKICAPPERITLQKFTDMISMGIELDIGQKMSFLFLLSGYFNLFFYHCVSNH